ncbi:class F sortase [Cohnella yongneupensis]|uniref:Class F sortase n=1 Tax=Cohnella yongneupensis TaxID=425006 RepID=A0ABW0QWK9_9BACL
MKQKTQVAQQVEPSHSDRKPIPVRSAKNKPYPNGITPARIYIPAIDLHSQVEFVDVMDNGQMGVPNRSDTVGYLSNGILPGAVGNAVMDGHYDSRTGPAVFFRLKQLKPGDIVIVKNERGEYIEFAVQSVKTYGKSVAPIAMIFGPTQESNLNLITCAGKYSRKLKEHQERLVVFTKRLS